MDNLQNTRIEQYLDRTLPPDDRATFEAELTQNPALAAELRLHEAARAAVEVQSLFDRREAILQRSQQKLRWRVWWWKTLDVLERIFLKKRADGSGHLRWSLVAAIALSATLLLILAVKPEVFMPALKVAPKPQAVPKENVAIAFNAYFKRIDLSSTLGSGDPDSLYSRARDLYASDQCVDALPLLDQLLSDQQFGARPTALLLKGTCLLEAGDATAAIELFRQVPPTAAGPYQSAEWYTALAYLKLEDAEAASALLRNIAENPRHRHHEEAALLLAGR